MSWARWKALEREVADYYGVTRRTRMSYSEEAGDIVHPTLQIECKYGKQVPMFARVKVPTIINGKYMLVPSTWPDNCMAIKKKVKRVKFLEDTFEQCARYSDKTPVAALKAPKMRGFIIVVLHKEDV